MTYQSCTNRYNTNIFNYNSNTFSVRFQCTSSQTSFSWVVLLKAVLLILRMLHLLSLVSNSKLKNIASEKGTTVFIQLIINIAETCIWVTQNFNPSKTILSLYIHIWSSRKKVPNDHLKTFRVDSFKTLNLECSSETKVGEMKRIVSPL